MTNSIAFAFNAANINAAKKEAVDFLAKIKSEMKEINQTSKTRWYTVEICERGEELEKIAGNLYGLIDFLARGSRHLRNWGLGDAKAKWGHIDGVLEQAERALG